MNDIQVIDKSGWYDLLVEDCKAIVTEAVFTSRWALVEGYHQLGERIVTDENYSRHARDRNYVSRLTLSTEIPERTIWRAIQFYNKYPELEEVPEGKNVSFHTSN